MGMTPAEMLKRQGFYPLPGAFAPVVGQVAKAINDEIGSTKAQDAHGIGDAFNAFASVREFFYDVTVRAAYERVFSTRPTFLQACDVHNGFVQGNWHRDCANKNLKKGPDWDESSDAYRNYKLMIYLECDDYSFCVKPRTNHRKLGDGEGEESYFTVSVEDAAKTDFDKVDQPVQFVPKPGDAVMFDLRTVHRGQGLNSEKFSKRASNKLTLSYVFADRNPHAHRFHSFRTMLKHGYKPFDDAIMRRLNDAGLWWDRLATNYFDGHKDELDFVTLK